MKIKDLVSKDTMVIKLKGSTKEEVINELVEVLYENEKIENKEEFKKSVLEREKISSTGLEDGIAIPHGRSRVVKNPTVAIGISKEGIDYDSLDGEKSKIFFLIAVPETTTDIHIEILSKITSSLMEYKVREKILAVETKDELYDIVNNFENKNTNNSDIEKNKDFYIGVTGCAVGVAHTYLAAECLEKAAKENGVSIKVETNGSIGVKNAPTEEEIRKAKGIIIASDKQVDLDRFNGKRLIITNVKDGIKNADKLIKDSIAEKGEIYQGTKKNIGNDKTSGNLLYRSLMNGVSHMVPLVIVGGILIALSLALGGEPTAAGLQIPPGSHWNDILNIGVVGFTLMIPILSGYIAYSIGDKPALAPGLIGGWIANNGSFYGATAGTGFIGAIISGILVGYFVLQLKKINFPKIVEPLVPIMIIPITASLFIGVLFIFIIGAPISSLMTVLNNMLISLSAGSLVIIGLVIGLMQGFDMGGPFGKVAFLFSVGLIADGQLQFMGAQAAAIPVAPLGMGLATIIAKKKGIFTSDEIENGKAALAMGMVGISEGAIPFAAADPLAVIPANMIGSAVACILGFLFGLTDSVAHGGPIVVLLGAMNKPMLALIAMLIGSITTAVIVITLKTLKTRKKN
ncbi:fructose-specific PTS transporter subunit EIIC [Fusobacterium sp.]|uniref:PTS fructose transporter subunit IIABC n=1 Tax=Fusobacterium sp. TaxID=68766 RepID=UPI0026030BDC|nr:fructose-specific PTS transporter subunit EIIC [Fusobacterium sp.]